MANAAAPGAITAMSGSGEQTIPGAFFKQVRRYGNRDYVHHSRNGEWLSISWNQMAESVTRVACGLVEAGLRAGDHVALISENRIEWIYCDWAIQAAGGITVPIYTSCPPPVVRYMCRDSATVAAVASSDELAAKLEVKAPLARVIRLDGAVAHWLETEPAAELRAEIVRRLEALDPDQVATVIYTSGTTGEPKGVMLTHRNFVEMAHRSLEVFPITEADVILSWLPYSHVYERMDGVFLETMAGATLWLGRGMDTLAEDIPVVRPTLMCGVPRVFEKMYELVYDGVTHETRLNRRLFNWAISASARRLHGEESAILGVQATLADRLVLRKLNQRLTGGRLRCFFSGGAPLNEKVEEFFWILGVRILQGWGLTESTSCATTNTETVHRYRSVGKPIPGTELRIAADGEILLRGPGVMVGYKNKPEATNATVVDGWLHTGDIGFVDQDGFLTITDRKKDLIKTAGGKYVAPLSLEAKLQADRYIKTATVFGDGRPYVVALIVPDWDALAVDRGFVGDPGRLASDMRLLAFFQPRVDAVNSGLASYETIKRFALLPREFSEASGELTPSLKPKRRAIQQNFLSVIEKLYQAPQRSVDVGRKDVL